MSHTYHETVRLAIGKMLILDETEVDAECAKLRMAQAIARCEAAKCQAGIRAGRMILSLTQNPFGS